MKGKLSDMEKKSIEQIVDYLLDKFDYHDGSDIYVDITRLVNVLGFQVGESDKFNDTEDGFILVKDDKKIIGVNKNRTIEDKRFIIAHELGHYLIHRTDEETFFMHRENLKGKNNEENDADYFAACLLMPSKSFKAIYEIITSSMLDPKENDIIPLMQKLFRTPKTSISRRIDEVIYE